MTTNLAYTIKFVSDMDTAVLFHTAELGLKLRFQSPEWSEFDTGQTTLALHKASEENPAGTCQVGFRIEGIEAFILARRQSGVNIVSPPINIHGQKIAKLRDPDGAIFSVAGN